MMRLIMKTMSMRSLVCKALVSMCFVRGVSCVAGK